MNWDAIGAVGETLGAIAVLVTLLFLIFQLRQNTRAIEAESARSSFDAGANWMYKLIEDPELATLYRKGLALQLDTPDERMRFHMLMQALFNHWAIAHVYRSGDFQVITDADIAHVVSTPGGAKYWARAQQQRLHSGEFVKYVNAICASPATDA